MLFLLLVAVYLARTPFASFPLCLCHTPCAACALTHLLCGCVPAPGRPGGEATMRRLSRAVWASCSGLLITTCGSGSVSPVWVPPRFPPSSLPSRGVGLQGGLRLISRFKRAPSLEIATPQIHPDSFDWLLQLSHSLLC